MIEGLAFTDVCVRWGDTLCRMQVVVTTPTGQIGRAVARMLLDAGVEVVLPVRKPEAVGEFAARGARIVVGSQTDIAFMTSASRGADALFWVTPPDYHAADFRAHQRACGEVAAAAIRGNGIGRVVNLSSLGAHVGSGMGQVDGAAEVEHLVDGAARAVNHLRPAYFMENFLQQRAAISNSSSIFLPMSPTTRAPMIATRDIARVAVGLLLDDRWTDRKAIELLGPADTTFAEAAVQIGAGLGRSVSYVQIAEDRMRDNILRSGRGGASFVDQLLLMYRAIESGAMRSPDPRSPANTTPTTLEEFARDVMAPLFA